MPLLLLLMSLVVAGGADVVWVLLALSVGDLFIGWSWMQHSSSCQNPILKTSSRPITGPYRPFPIFRAFCIQFCHQTIE